MNHTPTRPQASQRPYTGSQSAPARPGGVADDGTIQIHGKAYTTVARRSELAHARGGYSMLASEVCELGSGSGRLFVRVTILVGDHQFIGSAEVKLSAKPGTPDGDAPLETAETSALGRALGFAGFASAQSIASADELQRVTASRGA